MFKGIFDFKNQSLIINWAIIVPVIFYIIVGLLALSSTSNFNNLFLLHFINNYYGYLLE